MLIAVFADIHSNRQAFAACLADSQDRKAEAYVLLGDYVGYGADPEWVMEKVTALAARGATAVLGNHDSAIGKPEAHMNVPAQIVIEWTRGELGAADRDFLAKLPLTARVGDALFVHASAARPASWPYIVDVETAAESFLATDAFITFCGHVHRPALYSRSAAAKMTAFIPTTDVPIPCVPGRRWLITVGSVGQPRDGNPAASYLTFDTETKEIVFRRVPYDIDAAAARIRSRGLPAIFADRLFEGR